MQDEKLEVGLHRESTPFPSHADPAAFPSGMQGGKGFSAWLASRQDNGAVGAFDQVRHTDAHYGRLREEGPVWRKSFTTNYQM